MSKAKKRGLVSPLNQQPDPPVFIRGPMANRLMTMILDQPKCQSCARRISMGERWGVVADVQREGKEDACIQAVRLCEKCWGFPASAMRKLGRAWE